MARQPELVLVGALAWCFAMAGLADRLGLSYEMGALVAGVMVSTFPYTLDVVAKVTSIRDFFVTLFFVGLGMEIPMPTWHFMLWALLFCVFIIGSRLITIFPPLYFMRQGYRVSLLSTINLCQMSELSLVLLALGAASGEVSENSIGIAAFAFAFLAVGSTYAILKNDTILRRIAPQLNRLRLARSGPRRARNRRPEKIPAHLPAGLFLDSQFADRRNQPGTSHAADGNHGCGF